MRGYMHVRQRRPIEYTQVEPFWRVAKTSAGHRHERTIRDSSVHSLTNSCNHVLLQTCDYMLSEGHCWRNEYCTSYVYSHISDRRDDIGAIHQNTRNSHFHDIILYMYRHWQWSQCADGRSALHVCGLWSPLVADWQAVAMTKRRRS